MSPQTSDPLDALAAQHGAAGAPSADPLDALAAAHGSGPQMTFARVNGQDVSVDDPNTIGTFASHVWQNVNPIPLGQMIPFTKAAGGAGWDAPVHAIKTIGAAQEVPLQNAKASYEKGDWGGAAIHLLNYLIPVFGPLLDKSGNELRDGKYAAGLGDALGLGAALLGPEALLKLGKSGPLLTNPNPEQAAAVRFGQDRGIPVDAGSATGNKAVKGVQFLADRTIGGSLVAEPAKQAQTVALARVGGDLAQEARGVAITPEQAGQGIRDALASKIQAHADLADHAYERLRQFEEAPGNRTEMPVPQKPAAVDGLKDFQRAQLRRIVHEMDASGYSPTTWRDLGEEVGVKDGNAGGGQYQRTPGSAGAKVFDDIKANLSSGSNPTRSVVQNQIEAYLAGGPETNITRAALEVANDRFRGASTVSAPELDASVMQTPTRLEATRPPKWADMGLPVDLTDAKQALAPLYEQMKRQMPVTQQQSSFGLKAIENILNAPDYAPLSQVDRDLGAIKAIARDHGGMAKLAVARVDAAVRRAAMNGGLEVWQTLQQGRQATTAKYLTQELADALPGGKMAEPMAVFRAVTAPKDGGIELLRAVTDHVKIAPQLARAKLEDLLSLGTDKQFTEWSKLGSQTKGILFPAPGQAQALDHFFRLSKMLAENPNPSGTAYIGSLGVQWAAFWTNPVASLVGQVGAAGLSKLLHSPTAVQALTRGLVLAKAGPAATATARAATWAQIVQTAARAGVPLTTPGPAAAATAGATSR